MLIDSNVSSKSRSAYRSGKRQYFNRKNPCPICNKDSGCSQYKNSGLVECLRGLSQQDAPPGYRFVKLLTGNMGGMFALDTSIDRSDYRSREREQTKLTTPKERLCIEERHLGYRKLANKQDLSATHFNRLVERGLNIKQINEMYEQAWIRSWYTKANPVGINRNLAGVHPVTGDLVGMDGISIAALDPDEKITGLQIATDNRDFAKYIWASSYKHGGSGPQLPNGELPLFCWRHPDQKIKVQEVWLCEGALKSLLVAQFLWDRGYRSIAVIGTASAARYGSKTLSDYLKRLNPKQICLMPDAGAIANDHILPALRQTIADCQSWGYKIHVGWWGQVNKSHSDIDELLAQGNGKKDKKSEIEFLLPETFEETIKNGGIVPELVIENAEQEEEEGIISEEQWMHRYGLPSWIKNQVKRVYRRVSKFGHSINKEESKSTETSKRAALRKKIVYHPGCIPWRRGYDDQPIILQFKRQRDRERILAYQECAAKGWVDILDISQPGTGKSHDAGNLLPRMFFEKENRDQDSAQSKLIHLSTSGRNPTVETLERNFFPLPVRHNGMKYDFAHKTPLGRPHEVWVGKGEKPDTISNCHLAEVHQKLAGRFLQEGLHKPGKDSKNPICLSCPFYDPQGGIGCKGAEGEGYGYKSQMHEALQYDRIRATPQGMPSELKGNYGVIVDEAMSTLSQIRVLTVDSEDIARTIAVIYKRNPELYNKIAPLLTKTDVMLRGLDHIPNFGFTLADIRERLGEKPEDIDELLRELENLIQSEGKDNIEAFTKTGVMNPALIDQIVIKNWLVLFLKVYAGNMRGSLRISRHEMEITLINQRELNLLRGAKVRIYQDATARVERLAQFLEIDESEIIICEQIPPKYNHLKVVQIQGLPELGKNRSQDADRRIEALVDQMNSLHSDLGVIDWKSKAATGTINHFSGGRGSNLYQHKDAITILGNPYQNLSAIQDKYQTLSGQSAQLGNRKGQETSPDLQAYINELVEDEVYQEIGRIRASRRQEQLTIYLVSEFSLTNILLKLDGCQYERIEAFIFTPFAGNQSQVSRWKLLEGFKLLTQKGQDIAKMTQEMLAEVSGHGRSRIAQIASEFGGWKRFKQLLTALINDSISTTNNLSAEEEWLAKTYLPLVIEEDEPISEIASLVKIHGFEGVIRILKASSVATQAKILGEIFKLVPRIDQFVADMILNE